MEDEKVLLDAAYIKLRNNEPMALNDLKRFINMIANASFNIEAVNPAEVAGVQSQFISVLQQKFMRGQQPQP